MCDSSSNPESGGSNFLETNILVHQTKMWRVTNNSNFTTYSYGNLNSHISSSLSAATLFQPYSAILFHAPLPRAVLLQFRIFIFPRSALTSSYQNLGLPCLHNSKNCLPLRHLMTRTVTLDITLYIECKSTRLLLVLYIHILLKLNTSYTK